MRNSIKAKVKKQLKGLFDLKGMEVTKESLQLWLANFRDVTERELADAILGFTRNSSAYPTPEGVRAYIGDSRGIKDSQRPLVMWPEVKEAIRVHGSYRTVSFEPITNATIRKMGGWLKLCNTPPDEMKWQERKFAEVYAAVLAGSGGDGSPLPGQLELDNGLGTEKPIHIGTNLPQHPAELRLEHRSSGNRKAITDRRQQGLLPDMRGIGDGECNRPQ